MSLRQMCSWIQIPALAAGLLLVPCTLARSQSPAPAAPLPEQVPLQSKPLQPRVEPPPPAPDAEAIRVAGLPSIHSQPYDQPSDHDLFVDYLHNGYGPYGLIGTTVRALYGEARGKPVGWSQDFTGFSQRFGSSAAVTAINASVRLGLEHLFHEDLRYIPCLHCTVKHKIENALLAEITARHGEDGHRFFSLTPTIADFSGPIVTHSIWYPGASRGPEAGVVAARTVFASRIGIHLFQELLVERHKQKQ